MKQYITIKMIKNSAYFQGLEISDHRFFCIGELFSPFIRPGELIAWFYNEKKIGKSYECMDLYKKEDCIELYDQSESFADESSYRGTWDITKRFIMTKENFLHILEQWEELRVSRPDIILVVIHEDNHVTLETDPVIIKEYQDAGYAFDIDKN